MNVKQSLYSLLQMLEKSKFIRSSLKPGQAPRGPEALRGRMESSR